MLKLTLRYLSARVGRPSLFFGSAVRSPLQYLEPSATFCTTTKVLLKDIKKNHKDNLVTKDDKTQSKLSIKHVEVSKIDVGILSSPAAVPTRRKFKWTSEYDQLLTESVGLFKETMGWARVAKHMGHGLTWQQCANRWNGILRNSLQPGINQEDWTDEEVRKLVELVPRRQFDPKVNNCIDWVAIGAKLNRIPSICKFKWRDLVNTTLKKGAFSEKEDALITKRVMERGRKGNNMKGFWMSLQQEMSRSNSALSQRWNRVLKPRLLLHSKNPTRSLQVARSKNLKRQVRVRWTKEMDQLLKEGVALHKETGGWVRVSEHVGQGLTWQQCSGRWSNYVASAQQRDIKHGSWSTEELEKLAELVPQHLIKPFQSKALQVQSKDRINWVAIGRVLGRSRVECQSVWIYMHEKRKRSLLLQGDIRKERQDIEECAEI